MKHRFVKPNTSSHPHCVNCDVPKGSVESKWNGGVCTPKPRSIPETALVKRLRACMEQADDARRDVVTIDRHDAERILTRLLYGCGERNTPVRHPR